MGVMFLEGKQMRFMIVLALSLVFFASSAFGDELTVLYKESAESVVFLEVQDPFGNVTKYGTGFFVGDGCAIATNYHVVRGGFRVRYGVPKAAGTTLIPDVRVDREHDLAVIRVRECGKPLRLANELPEVGEAVFAIGNPQGLNYSLSNGVISGVRTEGIQLLQTTAAISPGSSGGPLIDMKGTVVGITTFYLVEGQSLNFAIPSQAVINLLVRSGDERNLAEEFPEKDEALSVAAAFLFAISENDVEKAISFVEPRYQTEFEEFIRSTPPTIPKNAVLKITEGKPIGGAAHSEISIVGENIGVDVVKYRDGWWVTK